MLAGVESEMTYFVDAGTGVLNGRNNLYGGVVGFLENVSRGCRRLHPVASLPRLKK